MGLTREPATRAAALRFTEIPDVVRGWARQCAPDDPVAMLLPQMQEQGGPPAATIHGRPARLPVLPVVLVTGAASHALDLDDVNRTEAVRQRLGIVPEPIELPLAAVA
jgi:hypothetical protein